MFRGISRTLFRKVREIGQLQDLFYALIDLVDEQLYVNLQERDAELRRLRIGYETPSEPVHMHDGNEACEAGVADNSPVLNLLVLRKALYMHCYLRS